MISIPLRQLITLRQNPAPQACFAISENPFTHDKSTFLQVHHNVEAEHLFGAFPTPLCGGAPHQYHPCFVMAILSVTPFVSPLEEKTLHELPLPKVLFHTDPDIRRSMTLNAMRMSTELFDAGSERVFALAENRLEAGQTDVVHDLLVYLMHAILDARRAFEQEQFLRAESIAAYLGLDPLKVLLLLKKAENNATQLTETLEQGHAGTLRRQLDLPVLVKNQLELLTPYQQNAFEEESNVRRAIGKIVERWKRT
jgi:hypothetical protein